MSVIQQYLTKKLLHDNHPSMDDGRCMNHKQHKIECKICRTVCPAGVFDKETPDWALCQSCDVCVSLCPTRCLSPSGVLATKVMEICARWKGDLIVGCEHQEGEADLILPCLASVSWELYAYFSLSGHVHLLCGSCDSCPNQKMRQAWQYNFQQVERFLGDALYRERILFHQEDGAPSQRGYTRKEVFSLVFSKSKATLNNLLPEFQKLKLDGLLYRQLLVHRIQQLNAGAGDTDGLTFSWTVFDMEESCRACGLCEKICPNQAIHRIPEENPRDGEQTWYMAFIPWRCTDCGLCTLVCPSHALEKPIEKELLNPAKPLVHAVTTAVCRRCKGPVMAEDAGEDGLCRLCRAEISKEPRWMKPVT